MRDLMYFIASALTREDRAKYEAALIRSYYEKLVEHGVRDYSLQECLRGYRLSVLDLYYFMVSVLALLDFTVNEEAVAIRNLILDRWGGIILDHQPAELLPGHRTPH